MKDPEFFKRVIEDLEKSKDDPVMMSIFRRATSRTLEHRAYRYLVRWVNITYDRDRIVMLCIATCYAIHKNHSEKALSLGASLKLLANSRGGTDSFSSRFMRVIGYDLEAVCHYLPILIQSMRDIEINFEHLFKDLWYWENNDIARRAWSQDYWG